VQASALALLAQLSQELLVVAHGRQLQLQVVEVVQVELLVKRILAVAVETLDKAVRA
jgi:hypothetical protein